MIASSAGAKQEHLSRADRRRRPPAAKPRVGLASAALRQIERIPSGLVTVDVVDELGAIVRGAERRADRRRKRNRAQRRARKASR